MADQALENAIARRDALKGQVTDLAGQARAIVNSIKPLLEEMKSVNDFIQMWYTMAGIEPPADDENLEQIEDIIPPPPKVERPRNPDRIVVVNKVVDYIREAGRPLMRRDLFERLQNDGIIIRGKDPEMVLSTMLWRTKELVSRLRGGGYWPTADPLPPSHDKDVEDLI